MNLLITGASGFLGRHVVKLLRNREDIKLFTPSSDELELIQAANLSQYLVNNEISHIIHLAANVGGIGANRRKPADFMYDNLMMGLNVLRNASLNPYTEKVINIGTICSYPRNTPAPFKETDLFNGYPEDTNAPYGIAKRAIMIYGDSLNKQHGIKIVNLMPVNLAGEYDNFYPLTSHVIPAIILKVYKAKKLNMKRIELWGTGEATREFLYAGDCAKAIELALDKYETPDPINIGSGQEIKIKILAEWIATMMQWNGEIVFTGQVSDGQPRRLLDTNKAKEKLGFEATTSLVKILLKEIEYFNGLNLADEYIKMI